MRHDGFSASVAARQEGMKLQTFLRAAGNVLYRSGPGKPWKVRSDDKLPFLVKIPTSMGPQVVLARDYRERKLGGAYLSVLRMWRADENGAEAALKAFEGKKVGGHTLITDTKLLIELEEAERLNVDSHYKAIGARS